MFKCTILILYQVKYEMPMFIFDFIVITFIPIVHCLAYYTIDSPIIILHRLFLDIPCQCILFEIKPQNYFFVSKAQV